jgi:hypothetical protein
LWAGQTAIGGRRAVSEEEWSGELTRLGLINGEKPDSKRSLISEMPPRTVGRELDRLQ